MAMNEPQYSASNPTESLRSPYSTEPAHKRLSADARRLIAFAPQPCTGRGRYLLYVGGEVSIGSFLINYLGEHTVAGLAPADAARYVSYYWGGAMIGRSLGFADMRRFSPGKTLAFNAACAIALIVVAVFGHGALAMWAILAVGLFNSIMFPTIFSMALHGLGARTSNASEVLCMAIGRSARAVRAGFPGRCHRAPSVVPGSSRLLPVHPLLWCDNADMYR
jgi:fucose permease